MSDTPRPRRRLATVREVCQEYLTRVVAARASVSWHWHTQRVRVTEFMAAKGHILLEDLIGDDLEKWIEEHPAWHSSWTKKNVAQMIKRPFSWAWSKGLINCHPLKGVSYPRGKRGTVTTEEQFRKILRHVSADFRRILFFMWWTGARAGEACALKWEFIDMAKATAVLQAHKTAYTNKGPRVIHLPEKVIRMFIWMLDDQRDGQEYVFTNRDGNRCVRSNLDSRILRMRERLGLPASVKLHGCRHNFITRLLKNGVPLKTVSILAGHASVAMTEHYTHLEDDTEHLHEALEKGLDGKKGAP